MSQTMVDTTKGRAVPNPQRFGYEQDAAAAGRRGGKASVLSRRLKGQRELERRIAEETKNGAAMFGLLRLREEREQDLRNRRAAADAHLAQTDYMLCGLLNEVDANRGYLERLKAEYGEKLAAVRELEDRERLLEQAARADEAELLDRLRELHEAGKLEPLLVALDVFDTTEVDQ
jgi:hypothetical protein